MPTFNVHLKTGRIVEVQAKYAKITNGVAIFYNDRLTFMDRYKNGPEIVAAFLPSDYSYFKKN